MPKEQWRNELQEYALLLEAVASGDRSKVIKLFGEYLLKKEFEDAAAQEEAAATAEEEDQGAQIEEYDYGNYDENDYQYDPEAAVYEENVGHYTQAPTTKKVRFANEASNYPNESQAYPYDEDNYYTDDGVNYYGYDETTGESYLVDHYPQASGPDTYEEAFVSGGLGPEPDENGYQERNIPATDYTYAQTPDPGYQHSDGSFAGSYADDYFGTNSLLDSNQSDPAANNEQYYNVPYDDGQLYHPSGLEDDGSYNLQSQNDSNIRMVGEHGDCGYDGRTAVSLASSDVANTERLYNSKMAEEGGLLSRDGQEPDENQFLTPLHVGPPHDASEDTDRIFKESQSPWHESFQDDTYSGDFDYDLDREEPVSPLDMQDTGGADQELVSPATPIFPEDDTYMSLHQGYAGEVPLEDEPAVVWALGNWPLGNGTDKWLPAGTGMSEEHNYEDGSSFYNEVDNYDESVYDDEEADRDSNFDGDTEDSQNSEFYLDPEYAKVWADGVQPYFDDEELADITRSNSIDTDPLSFWSQSQEEEQWQQGDDNDLADQINPHYNPVEEGQRFYDHYSGLCDETKAEQKDGRSRKGARYPRSLVERLRERLRAA